jgi:S-DNA-T family DNA segregation ATPase FtsK/SpoIIIE
MSEQQTLPDTQRKLVSQVNAALVKRHKADEAAEARRDAGFAEIDGALSSIDVFVTSVQDLLKKAGWWYNCANTSPASRDAAGGSKRELDAAVQEARQVQSDIRDLLVRYGQGDAAVYKHPFPAIGWAFAVGFVAALVLGIAAKSPVGGALGGLGVGVGVMMIAYGASPRPKDKYAELLGIQSQATEFSTRCRDEVIAQYQRATEEAETQLRKQEIASLSPEIASYANVVEETSPIWDSERWQDWHPAHATPSVLKIGTLSLHDVSLSLPAVIPGFYGRSILIETLAKAKKAAAAGVQSMATRLLATTQPANLRLTIIDPLALGESVSMLMALADHDEELVTGKAWTEPNHIEQRLAELTEHMENVIQNILRDDFPTIAEYNAQAGRLAQAYRLLLVFDFPTNMSDTAVRRLTSILKNGPRCGVFSIVLRDMDAKPPYGFNEAEFEQNCEVIRWSEAYNEFEWVDDDYEPWSFEWELRPPEAVVDNIVKGVGGEAVAGKKVEIPFADICPPANQWWSGSTEDGISIPIGPEGVQKVRHLELGKGTAIHALIAGRTGSGKSTLLHAIITSLGLTYSPEEVQLYLIDFKKGVEFKCYATESLPHARVIAIESEREFGLSVLQGLDAEMNRRGEMFRGAGAEDIASYRTDTANKLPRILLIVDEFHEFFTEDDAIASAAAQILDRIVRQGRAFGIHVILGSQTLAGAYNLHRSTIEQIGVRIALQCSEADSRLILAEDNPQARQLSRPGEAVYNDSNGRVEGNRRFQVAWLDDEDRNKYLRQLRQMADSAGERRSYETIVFEGNAPALASKNQALSLILDKPSWETPTNSLTTWLGEPMTISDHVAAHFRRQSGSSLVMVGQNEDLALGMISHALVALGGQLKPASGYQPFRVFDFSLVDSENAHVLEKVLRSLPHGTSLIPRRQLADAIAELCAEVDRRLTDPDGSHPSIFFVLHGLQRARDLRPDEDTSFGLMREAGAGEPASRQFSKIVREGPDLGVHSILSCDTMTNLNRSAERGTLREFAMRVAFQMSAEHSASLIDSPAASRLGPFRGIFLDENEGRIEKFRPYGLPDSDWLSDAFRGVRSSATNPSEMAIDPLITDDRQSGELPSLGHSSP